MKYVGVRRTLSTTSVNAKRNNAVEILRTTLPPEYSKCEYQIHCVLLYLLIIRVSVQTVRA